MEEIIVKILTFVAAIVKDFKGFKGFFTREYCVLIEKVKGSIKWIFIIFYSFYL